MKTIAQFPKTEFENKLVAYGNVVIVLTEDGAKIIDHDKLIDLQPVRDPSIEVIKKARDYLKFNDLKKLPKIPLPYFEAFNPRTGKIRR